MKNSFAERVFLFEISLRASLPQRRSVSSSSSLNIFQSTPWEAQMEATPSRRTVLWIAYSGQRNIKWMVVPIPSFAKHIRSVVSRKLSKLVFS